MKKLMKPIAAFLPAMLLLLVGMRFFGLITIRNSSTDYENISRILKSPDPKFTDLVEIYQYEYNLFNLIVLLAALIIILIICINIRNGTIRKCIRKLRKRFGRKKLPDFSTVLNQAISVFKGLQYGQLSDVKRRYRVIMSICGNHQTFLFAADKSEKSAVMDLSCFDAISASGNGLSRISIPQTLLLWNRRGVSLITRGNQFDVVGEDRSTNCVSISAGEHISVEVGGVIINLIVS